jgi:hypothetical protein
MTFALGSVRAMTPVLRQTSALTPTIPSISKVMMEGSTWHADSNDGGGCRGGSGRDGGGLRCCDEYETLTSLTSLSSCTEKGLVCSIGTLQDDVGIDIGQTQYIRIQTDIIRSKKT